MQRVHFPGVDTYTESHSSEDSLGRAGIHAKLPSTLNPLMHSPWEILEGWREILEGWRESAFHPSGVSRSKQQCIVGVSGRVSS